MDADRRKLLSLLAHASIFINWTFVSFALPIALYLLIDDVVVKNNAKEAINFHLNLYIYAAIVAVLYALVITIPAAVVLSLLYGLAVFIFPIIAMIQVASSSDRSYRYPFIFHIL